jgi:hypothetical protein
MSIRRRTLRREEGRRWVERNQKTYVDGAFWFWAVGSRRMRSCRCCRGRLGRADEYEDSEKDYDGWVRVSQLAPMICAVVLRRWLVLLLKACTSVTAIATERAKSRMCAKTILMGG